MGRRVRSAIAALAAAVLIAACTSPVASLILGLLPDGTFTALLNNLQGVSDKNRSSLAQLAEKGDWAGMLKFAQDNIAIDPTTADWHVVAGYAQAQLGQYQPASESFQRAIQISPDEIGAWNLLAQSYRSMKQPDRAIRVLERALTINQSSPITWYLIGASYNDMKRFERAIPAFEQALQRQAQFPDAWYGIATSYAALGRRMEYEQAARQLRSLDPVLADRLAAAQAGAAVPAGNPR